MSFSIVEELLVLWSRLLRKSTLLVGQLEFLEPCLDWYSVLDALPLLVSLIRLYLTVLGSRFEDLSCLSSLDGILSGGPCLGGYVSPIDNEALPGLRFCSQRISSRSRNLALASLADLLKSHLEHLARPLCLDQLLR